jgi:hypothetical protein
VNVSSNHEFLPDSFIYDEVASAAGTWSASANIVYSDNLSHIVSTGLTHSLSVKIEALSK